MLKDLRRITPESCVDYPTNKKDALKLDVDRARFIVKKRFRGVAGSRRLGELWLALDPLFLGLIYYFVFTVIRHKTDPVTVFIGITYIRILQQALKSGYSSMPDFTGGLKIERVRTRAIIISEFLLGISNSFFACVGIGVIFLVIFEVSLSAVLIFWLLGLITYFFWYTLGNLFSPISMIIPDTKPFVSYLGTMMLFGSPALYTLSETTGLHRTINLYNPITFCIEPARAVIVGSSDYLLLSKDVAILLASILILLIIVNVRRFDGIRWRFSTWS